VRPILEETPSRSPQSIFRPRLGQPTLRHANENEIIANGRHEETRTPDLYRANFEVNNLKPFPYLAFPHFTDPKIARKWPSFDDELMTSFLPECQALFLIEKVLMM
jgi:hypothetical protein